MGILEMNSTANTKALALIATATTKDLAYLAKSFKDTQTADQVVLEAIYDRAEVLITNSTNVQDIAYLNKAVNDLVVDSGEDLTLPAYKMFKTDGIGSGVAAIPNSLLPQGYRKLYGHEIPSHPNHGKVCDAYGSIFKYIAPFYFKMVANTISVSNTYQPGFVKPMEFIRNPNGFFIAGYLSAKKNNRMVSTQGLDPLSTNSAHNPISALVGAPANTYAGWVDACKYSGYEALTIFQWNVLQLITLYMGQSAFGTSIVAFNDVAPFFPKGCNNNALKDVNDTSVTFTSSGYSNCALTGSGSNFAKTTHNGQDCGVADVNGNMWKVVFGLTYLAKTGAVCASGATAVAMTAHGLVVNDVIYFGVTPSSGATYNTAAYTVTAVTDANNFTVGTVLERAILATDGVYSPRFFRILKTTVKTSTLTAANLLDEANYDLLDLTGIVNSNTGTFYFGNGTETVLNFSTDTNSTAYKMAACGLPTATGASTVGTDAFGKDYMYKKLVHGLVPIVGGAWADAAIAGSFALDLYAYSVYSIYSVGGFASVSL